MLLPSRFRFLDYLIEENQPAAVPVGSGLLIRVPDPARFAFTQAGCLTTSPRGAGGKKP